MPDSDADFANMEPTQAGHALSEWAERMQRDAETFERLQQEMTHLSATETSEDGAVRVTVDSQGAPTELTVTEHGKNVDPARISATLMRCLHAAQAQLTGQVRDLVGEMVPEDQAGAASRIVDSYRERFPEEGDSGEADGPSDQPSASSDHDKGEDDWGTQSFLR